MIAVLLLGGVGGVLVCWRSRDRRVDRRIGLLGAPVVPTSKAAVPASKAEASRVARLQAAWAGLIQLPSGTTRIYTYGKILRVDYARGELVVQRRAARRQQSGVADVYRVHNCGKILHVDYERGELVVERDLERERLR